MWCGPFLLFLTIALTSGLTVKETEPTTTDDSQPANTTARQARHLQEIEIPLPSKKIKRQIIKIPSSISKVKLIQPPLNLRHNRAPQQFGRYPSIYRSGGPWRTASKKSAHYDLENPFNYDLKKVKRNLKKPIIKEVTPEEFYRDEEFDYGQEKLKKGRQPPKVVKIKRKKPKQNILGDYLINYETDGSAQQEEEAFDSSKLRVEEKPPFYDPAGSTVQIQQVSPPNLQTQNYNPFESYDEKYPTGLKIEKLPTKGRQAQSLFSQQYTTHNPHVATNFGLRVNGVKGSFLDAATYEMPQLGRYQHPVMAGSNQVVTSLPVNTPGIQVIQPPQFKDVTVSHPSHPSRLISSTSHSKEEVLSQKATIRDILDQDCPGYDAKGYCDSPPRYPMQQIKKMVKKCANLMEVMNTQAFDEPYEVYGFTRRSDIEERSNKSGTIDAESDNNPQLSSWSRSATDPVTACTSDLGLTEPGYAKEVNSGRWFVIVQHPETTIQRIATDTCRSPGKSCGGLSEMKCTKVSLLSKSTRCVQRHTYQRLISWDPETPDDCPRMRVFRFPSACVCHLGV